MISTRENSKVRRSSLSHIKVLGERVRVWAVFAPASRQDAPSPPALSRRERELRPRHEVKPLPNKTKQFLLNTQGLAIVEFAMVLPFMFTLLFGGIELTRFTLIHQKMNKTVTSMADLVTQADSMSDAEINVIFQASEHLMSPFMFGNEGVIIISSIGRRDGGLPVINWQRSGGGSLSASSHLGVEGAEPTLPDGFALSDDEDAIVSEIFFTYEAMLDMGIMASDILYKRSIFRPRLGSLDEME